MSGHPPPASQPLADKLGRTVHTTTTNQDRWGTVNEHPAGSEVRPTITLDIPQWGYIFSQPPEEAIVQAELSGADPVYDVLLNGHVVITLPPGCQSIRCHRLTVGFRTWCILNMGLGREREEDVIFDRKVDLQDGSSGGILLDGNQRFAFSLIIPSHTAPRDWHPFGRVGNTLYAEVEGLPMANHDGRSGSPRSAHASGLNGASRLSPLRLFGLFGGSGPDAASDKASPVESASEPPEYSTAAGHAWLRGVHEARRVIRIAYNPDPAGEANTLDIHVSASKPALGQLELRLFSHIWTIAAGLRASLAIIDIPPTTTVFSFHVTLCQTAQCQSPRDGRVIVKTRHFRVAETGHRVPPHHAHPGAALPALYRGRAAGGKDEGALILELNGRVAENDFQVRPSTTRGIETPIHVSHVLQADLYFSVFGLDSSGKPMPKSGPGGLQVLRIRRHVMLPACDVLPIQTKLPEYGQPGFIVPPGDMDGPGAHCACYATSDEIEEQLNAAAAKEQEIAREADREVAVKQLRERGDAEGFSA